MKQVPAATAFTHGHERRDFVEWHRGRPCYLLWALDIDLPAVRSRVSAAQAHLAAELLPGYRRQPHVTLSLCGFPALRPGATDEFGAALLAAQLQALNAAQLAPFRIHLGHLDSFLAVPYLQISDDGGQLQQLHRLLSIAPPPGAGISYQPHLTLGLYRRRQPLRAIEPLLARFPPPAAALSVQIERLSLLAYASKDIDGPLTTVADYVLAGQGRQGDQGLQLRPAAATVLPFPLPHATAARPPDRTG